MKSVLLNTTVIGSRVGLPRHPRLIMGNPGQYVYGDILDANAVKNEIEDAIKKVKVDNEDMQELLEQLKDELYAAIDAKISELINGAPEELDTLGEIAAVTEDHTAWHEV